MSSPGTIENNGLLYKLLDSWEGLLGKPPAPNRREEGVRRGEAEISRRG